MFIYVYIYIYIHIYVYVYLSIDIYIFIYLSIHLSISIYLYDSFFFQDRLQSMKFPSTSSGVTRMNSRPRVNFHILGLRKKMHVCPCVPDL